MADTKLADHALITLEEYYDFIGGSQPGEDVGAGHMHRLINSVSKRIESHCGRIICPATDVTGEEFTGNDAIRYYVKNLRLNASPTLYYWDGTEWDEMSTSTYPREYHADGYVWLSEGDSFTEKTKYKIDYNTGYAQASVPDDIKWACVIVLQRAIKRAEVGLEGERSKSVGDVTVGLDLALIPGDVKEMLAPYKRIM